MTPRKILDRHRVDYAALLLNRRQSSAEIELRLGCTALGIPGNMHGGLFRYVLWGCKPGDFLCAVFRNDLLQTVTRADDYNARLLREYAHLVYNFTPSGCHGSAGDFDAWRARFGLADAEQIAAIVAELDAPAAPGDMQFAAASA